MKWGIVPLSAVVNVGRMDPEFFLGGDAKLKQAERLDALSTKHVHNAELLREEAAADRAAAAALGIVVHDGSDKA